MLHADSYILVMSPLPFKELTTKHLLGLSSVPWCYVVDYDSNSSENFLKYYQTSTANNKVVWFFPCCHKTVDNADKVCFEKTCLEIFLCNILKVSVHIQFIFLCYGEYAIADDSLFFNKHLKPLLEYTIKENDINNTFLFTDRISPFDDFPSYHIPLKHLCEHLYGDYCGENIDSL